VIAGFWRRVLGFFIDSIGIGLVGCVLGLFFFDYLAGLGGWGRLVGLIIASLYYIPMNSRLAGGRTLGKRFVGTRVVGRDGQTIGLGRSAIRFLVLAVPFFLKGAAIPPDFLLGWIGIIASVLVFGLCGSIVYLIIFNRRTRQSLHDLVAGTFVVKAESGSAPIALRTGKIHFAVVALLIVGSALIPMLIRPLISTDFFKPLIAVQQRIWKEPEVAYASVFQGVTKFWGPKSSSTQSYLMVSVMLRQKPADFDQEADKIAGIVLGEYPGALEKDQITVSIIYGFDIGIAHFSWSKIVPHSPKEWQDRLFPLSRKK
jgi:uncharacterized RDD family membrane protein YckC